MSMNVFGITSLNVEIKIVTSLFVRKSYMRTKNIGGKIEEEIRMKNQIKLEKLPNPVDFQDAVTEVYVDDMVLNP